MYVRGKDGWEALLGGDMLLEEGLERFVKARGAAAALVACGPEHGGDQAVGGAHGVLSAEAQNPCRPQAPARRTARLPDRAQGTGITGTISAPRTLRLGVLAHPGWSPPVPGTTERFQAHMAAAGGE